MTFVEKPPGISVAPQKGLVFSKNFQKKIRTRRIKNLLLYPCTQWENFVTITKSKAVIAFQFVKYFAIPGTFNVS